jgi:hypothetical protein
MTEVMQDTRFRMWDMGQDKFEDLLTRFHFRPTRHAGIPPHPDPLPAGERGPFYFSSPLRGEEKGEGWFKVKVIT